MHLDIIMVLQGMKPEISRLVVSAYSQVEKYIRCSALIIVRCSEVGLSYMSNSVE